MAVAAFSALLTTGAEIYEVGRLYPYRGLSAPVQNLSFLENVPFSLTIGQFLGIWIFLRLLIYITVAVMCLMISSFAKQVDRAQMISLVLLVFTLISGVSEYMVLGTERLMKTAIVTVMMSVCLCVSLAIAYRRWRNVYD